MADVLCGIEGIYALSISSSDLPVSFAPVGVAHGSDSVVVLWRVYALDSHERISNVEELEFPEICVGGVEGADLVLSK